MKFKDFNYQKVITTDTTQYSDVFDLSDLGDVAAQIDAEYKVSNRSAGQVIVTPQYSFDKQNWNDLTADAQTIAANGTTTDSFHNTQPYVRWKLVSSSSANLTLDIKAVPGSGDGQMSADTELGGAGGLDEVSENSNPSAPKIYSYLRLWSGSVWTFARSGITAVTATLTGFLNTLPWTVFHTTPTVRTNGQGGPMESDSNGNLQVNINTHQTGEDQDMDRLMTMQRYGYNVSVNSDTQIAAAPYFLHALTFSCNDVAPTEGDIIVYDNTSAAGNVIFRHHFTTTPFVPFTLPLNIETTLGLYIDFVTTADVNVAVSGMLII